MLLYKKTFTFLSILLFCALQLHAMEEESAFPSEEAPLLALGDKEEPVAISAEVRVEIPSTPEYIVRGPNPRKPTVDISPNQGLCVINSALVMMGGAVSLLVAEVLTDSPIVKILGACGISGSGLSLAYLYGSNRIKSHKKNKEYQQQFEQSILRTEDRLRKNKIPIIPIPDEIFYDIFDAERDFLVLSKDEDGFKQRVYLSIKCKQWELPILPYTDTTIQKKRLITFLCTLKKKKVVKDMREHILKFLPLDLIYNKHLFDQNENAKFYRKQLTHDELLREANLPLLPPKIISGLCPSNYNKNEKENYYQDIAALAAGLHEKIVRSLIPPSIPILEKDKWNHSEHTKQHVIMNNYTRDDWHAAYYYKLKANNNVYY